jgi:catabolite regulation protein CreA
VRRIIDPSSKNVVYVSYSQKVVSNDDSNKSRFKSSLCAVHIDD